MASAQVSLERAGLGERGELRSSLWPRRDGGRILGSVSQRHRCWRRLWGQRLTYLLIATIVNPYLKLHGVSSSGRLAIL
jgi:hypothetical protein